jgi:hypothetical protein
MHDRIRLINHHGKQVLEVDLSNCSTAEVEKIVRAVPEFVTTRPRGSLLILSDFTGASFDEEAVRAMKESAVFVKLKQASLVWSEFSDGAGRGWVVGLNTTGFPHIHLFQDYARAYHNAARNVFESFRQTLQDEDGPKSYREMNAHPIAFLYRHALELYLKTVIVWGEGLQQLRGRHPKPRKQTFKDHDLAKLLLGVKDIFGVIDCSGIWSIPTFQSFTDIERVVRAVNEFSHDAFRYPISHAGSDELLPCGVRFDVVVFAEKLDALLDLLEEAATRTWATYQTEARTHIP